MNPGERKEIPTRVRVRISTANMFRVTSGASMISDKNSSRYKESISIKNVNFDMPKQQNSSIAEMQRSGAAANKDILQVTSYFPKPRAVASRMLDYKSPERLVGVQEKRIGNTFDLANLSVQESNSSGLDITPFQVEMLSIHNKVRLMHNAPSLKLDRDLCFTAMKRAAYLAVTGKQEDTETEGINVWVFTKLKRSTEAREACENWYKEGKKYQYDVQKKFSAHNRHFTQMIWAETNLLGVGMAKGNGKIYIVALYLPKGNISGKYSVNVLKPRSSEKITFN